MLFSTAIESSTAIAGYLALFAGVGFVFVFVNLLVGRFLRPDNPGVEKQEIYECGEPPIGSSFVQFDLRFYVVALIFIIFDVEVAFLFPWATVFGKANHLANSEIALVEPAGDSLALTPAADGIYRELGVRDPAPIVGESAAAAGQQVQEGIQSLAQLATLEVLVFFLILLIGYAYVWKMGALDWIRAFTSHHRVPVERPSTASSTSQESVLSA